MKKLKLTEENCNEKIERKKKTKNILNKSIADILGHANIGTTIEAYVNAIDELK